MKQLKEFQIIFLAVDKSEGAKTAVKKAFFFAEKIGIDVVVVYILYFPVSTVPMLQPSDIHEMSDFIKKKGEANSNEIKHLSSEHNVNIEKKLLEGIPDDEIIKIVHKDDSIITGSKWHSFLDRILIGNVSEKVLRHSKIPVMIVR